MNIPRNELICHIRLAFQVQDDILDVEADTGTLGKPQGSDIAANTITALLGMLAQSKKHKIYWHKLIKLLEAMITHQ